MEKAVSPVFFAGMLIIFFKMLTIINHLERTVSRYYPLALLSNIGLKYGARIFSMVMRRM